MKQSKISRRSFLLGLGAVSAAAVLTACGGSSSASTAASGSDQGVRHHQHRRVLR